MFKDFYLIKGLEATVHRRYVDAYHFLTTYLTEHPKSSEGNRLMGAAWGQLGNYDESLRYLSIALDEDPSNQEALRDIGCLYLMKENYDLAQKYFMIGAKDPEAWEALKYLGYIESEGDRDEAAIDYFGKSLLLNPWQSDITKRLTKIYLRREENELAFQFANRLIDMNIFGPEELELIIEAAEKTGNHQIAHLYTKLKSANEELTELQQDFSSNVEGIRYLTPQLKIFPDNAVLYYQLGSHCLHAEQLEDAQRYSMQAATLLPDFILPYFNLFNIAKKVGDLQGALDILKKLIAKRPDSAEAWCEAANIYMDREEFETAILYFEKGLELEPFNYYSTNCMAYCLYKLNRIHESLHYYQLSLKLNPLGTSALSGLINIYQQSNDQLNLNIYRENLLALNNNDTYELTHYGAQLENFKNKASFAEWLSRAAIAADPDYVDGQQNLDNLLNRSQLRKDRKTELQEKLQDEPENQELINELATTYLKERDFHGVLYYVRQLVQLDPKNQQYNIELAQALHETHSFEEGMSFTEQAISNFPEAPEFYSLSALFKSELGMLKEATKDVLFTLSKTPNDAIALNTLATIRIKEGRAGEAEPILRKAIRASKSYMLPRTNLLSLLMSRLAYNEALPLIEDVLLQEPDNSRALGFLSMYYINHGDYRQAYQAAKAAITSKIDNYEAYKMLANLPEYINPDIAAHVRCWDLFSPENESVQDGLTRLNYALSNDWPMMTYRLVNTLDYDFSKENQSTLDIMTEQTQIAHSLSNFFQSWPDNNKLAVVNAGIVYYHLGDVGYAYSVLNGLVEEIENEFDALAVYYLYRCMLELQFEAKRYAKAMIDAFDIENSKDWGEMGTYYLALLFAATDNDDIALSLMESLAENFIPAKYQLGILYAKNGTFKSIEFKKQFLTEVLAMEQATNFDLNELIANITGDLDNFLDEINIAFYCLEAQLYKTEVLALRQPVNIKLRDIVRLVPVQN